MQTSFEQIVTVDGASGSGKTTLLRALAGRYDCTAIELGPVVRTVAWFAVTRRLSVIDAVAEMSRLASVGRVKIDRPAAGDLAASEVELDRLLMRQQIFSRRLNAAVTAVSLDAGAMAWIHSLVRTTVSGRRAVVSAREAARVVCPAAGLRIQLEASPQERRARKHRQLVQAGMQPNWLDDAQLLGSSEGVHWVVDTSRLSAEQVADVVGHRIERSLSWRSLRDLSTSGFLWAPRASDVATVAEPRS